MTLRWSRLAVFVFLLSLTCRVEPAISGVGGPFTMFTGREPAPNYPRVIQLQHSRKYNGRMYATFEHAIELRVYDVKSAHISINPVR